MIDFACKKFDIEEVVKCSLGLSKSEFRLLKFLIKNEGQFKTDKLAKELKLDKSTVQRAIKRLHKKKLVFRGQINQSFGGYFFTYKIKNKSEIRNMILAIVNGWNSRVKNEISKW